MMISRLEAQQTRRTRTRIGAVHRCRYVTLLREVSDHSDICRESRTVRRLIGIYDAEATLRGELTYWVGARLGRAHCALCDITHGLVLERADWKTLKADLPVPFVAFHRDDRPTEITAAVGEIAPVVVADTSNGVVRLLGPRDLEACAASPRRLITAIQQAVATAALTWPPSSE